MSNFSWDEPNSNFGRLNLSLLCQTSDLGHVESINWSWITSVTNFLPNEAKYTLPYNFLIYFISLVRRMWRSSFVPEMIFTRSIRLKQTDGTCWARWTIQTHLDELNWDRRRTFYELNSLTVSLVHLMKSSTFALGLTVYVNHISKKGSIIWIESQVYMYAK